MAPTTDDLRTEVDRLLETARDVSRNASEALSVVQIGCDRIDAKLADLSRSQIPDLPALIHDIASAITTIRVASNAMIHIPDRMRATVAVEVSAVEAPNLPQTPPPAATDA